MNDANSPCNMFSSQSIAFLTEVKSQNNKEWYENNKTAYEKYLLEPFQHLVKSLTPIVQEIDKNIEVSPKIGKTISRIYRDTRFSKDKSRFRDRMWLTFKRDKKNWIDSPVFFFEIRPHAFYYGLGYYAATRETMDRVRESISCREKDFLNATSHLLQNFTLTGDSYKRQLKPNQPERIAIWYNKKSFSVMKENNDIAEVFDHTLVNTLAEAFTQLAPLYNFLIRIEEKKNRDLEIKRSTMNI
ncbi:DUF2461 domain-containing protein [Serratia fonticola]